jgi:hypothetical protein
MPPAFGGLGASPGSLGRRDSVLRNQLHRVGHIDGVLRIHEGAQEPRPLRLGDGVQTQGAESRRLSCRYAIGEVHCIDDGRTAVEEEEAFKGTATR